MERPDKRQGNANSANCEFPQQRLWLSLAIGVAIAIICLLGWRPLKDKSVAATDTSSHGVDTPSHASDLKSSRHQSNINRPDRARALAAEEIVASKLVQFSQKRRQLVHDIARRLQKEVPEDIEKFFDALEARHWDQIKETHELLIGGNAQSDDAHKPFSPVVLDAYGVAIETQHWPAQQLLDYGNSILKSLRPGMVYVGGTDGGRFIPELLNETSEGEQHVIITQNGLADSSYLDFVNELYGDRLTNLNADESQRAFTDYIADARKRLTHDQENPEDPAQLRPGEEVRMNGERVQVSGQISVMQINELLLQALMQKNPGASFALEESFPLLSTYQDALPLGPLMELSAQDDQNKFTSERAAQSLAYWRDTAQQILSNFDATGSETTLKTYSHDAAAAGNLLAAHNFSSEAEEAFCLGTQLWPANSEAAGELANLLAANGRASEAREILNTFIQKYPDQLHTIQRISANLMPASNPGAKP